MQQKVPVRDRIVASARQLFSERGFHRTAIAELAQHAQVSVGTIYRSFASKSDIIRAIVLADTQDILGQLQAGIDQVRTGSTPGAVVLESMILSWVSKRDDPLNHEIVAEGHRDPQVAELISALCSEYRDLFRDLAQLLQPDLSATEVEGAAEILLACLFGMGNREFTHPRLDAAQTANGVAQLVLRSMRAGAA